MAVAPENQRVGLVMARVVVDRLDVICKDYGQSRAAMLTQMINQMWREGRYYLGNRRPDMMMLDDEDVETILEAEAMEQYVD